MRLKDLRKPLAVLLIFVMLSLLAIVVPRTLAAMVTITPGTVWTDTQGNVIQAHGEGIIQVGSTFYWLGEDKTNGSPFQNIKCYSSTDLKNWTFVNNVLTRQSSGDLGPNRVVERPHVIYNSSTSTYVMYMHIDNSSYTERRAGVATSSSVCGNYTYRGSFKPLGRDSLDDTLFQDGTTAYFISEDRTNARLQIYQLSADYLSVSSLVATLPQYESPAVVKIGGTYYIFGSHLTGWNTNDNQYATATSMSGPWSSWRSFAPSGTNTCNSQTTFILPVSTSSGTTYVFLGDRWNPSNLTDSRYVWLPLTISGTTVSMSCSTSWNIDVAPAVQAPYGGTPAAIPGTIQAENYDTGGEGVAYHDTTSGNSGNTYRTDGVDVETTTDSGGGYNVGWTEAGEWQEYTVNVTASGSYTLNARVASQSSGGTMHVEVDGVNVTGALTIPSTGGWQTWTTVTRTGVSLSAGQHVLRIAEDAAGFNVNWVSFTGGTPPVTTPPVTTPPVTTPPVTTPPVTTPPVTTPPPGTVSINAGGSATSSFSADQYFSGGSTYTNTATIDTSQVGSVPAAVFNTERYGVMTYTIPNRSGAQTVTLYFAETYVTAAGQRLFNVSINGAAALSNFDIFASAGGANRAIARSFTTTANASGQVVIQFTAVTENPKINGITVAGGGPTPTTPPATTPPVTTPPVTTPPPTTPPPSAVSINAGGSATGSFTADQYFSGGSTYTNTATIDMSQLTTNPPPAAIFNTERYGAMTYTIPDLTAGRTYIVTLYFAETYLTAAGQRLFNVSVNGATVLSSFDIYASAGGANRAIARSFTTTANSSGQVVIQFIAGTQNPKINGITVGS